jgi:hypothetical protein
MGAHSHFYEVRFLTDMRPPHEAPLDNRRWEAFLQIGTRVYPLRVYGFKEDDLTDRFAQSLGAVLRGPVPASLADTNTDGAPI